MLQAEKGNAAPEKEVADPTTTEVAKEVTVEKAGVGLMAASAKELATLKSESMSVEDTSLHTKKSR